MKSQSKQQKMENHHKKKSLKTGDKKLNGPNRPAT
ncbi:spore protein [Virgibacillus alimentarius]|uniref:Spore protein n=1 Tax=Virgibacillus alimentarius TaxID=698769 RepID=A0ABS4S4C0_9BACI|nr:MULTISPECIES: spore protein [Virgibacillus]MBP2256347.1 hypothetical protein [Virgibacillus alimentarius]HLR66292.1 spore protein [Virgibacillus sp.]